MEINIDIFFTIIGWKFISTIIQYGRFVCGRNFVSSHALAAVGQSTSIINMLVGFFMGLSTGAGVVIAQYFGAKETKKMQDPFIHL